MKKKERLQQRNNFRIPRQPPVETELLFPPLSQEAHKVFVETIVSGRPGLELEIRDKIARCRELFRRYDPAHLLTELADKWAFREFDPMANGSSGGDGDAFLEYAVSVAAATSLPIPTESPTTEIVTELVELIVAIHREASQFHAFQHVGKQGEESSGDSIRAYQMISAVYQRGMRYEHHQTDLVRSLFAEHDAFFAAHLGMSAEEIVAAAKSLYSQPLNNCQQMQETWQRVREVVARLNNPALNAKWSQASSQDVVVTLLKSLPEIQAVIPDFDARIEKLKRNPYLLEVSTDHQRKVLAFLSIGLGGNEIFLKPDKWACWPLTPSRVNYLPILQLETYYFAFAPHIIWRNLDKILASFIEATDAAYWETFQLKRGKWLERESNRLIASSLPGATLHAPLFYDLAVNGVRKRMEIDGLLTFDGHVVLVSAKAGQISDPARRGGLASLKTVFKELVKEGFDQIITARNYILAHPEGASFERPDGTKVCISPPVQGRFFFPINVTLDDLGSISMQFEELRAAGILKTEEFLWSVQITDLRVITEIIECSTSFLLYWNRRIAAYGVPHFAPCEELDCFMYFLQYGLYFQDEPEEENKRIFVNLTDDLDAYYGALELGLPVVKPRHALNTCTWELVHGLEKSRDAGFTVVGMFLSGASGSMQKFAANLVTKLKAMNSADGGPHQLTGFFNDFNAGVNIGCITLGDQGAMDKLIMFSMLKKYESKLTHWHTLLIEMFNGKVAAVRCHTATSIWENDPRMDRLVQMLKKNRNDRMGSQSRNDLCLCGSGEKYKRCCGK